MQSTTPRAAATHENASTQTDPAAPEGTPADYAIEVVWDGERRYRGGKPGVPPLLLDGNREVAPSPVDALLVAFAACSAIDVVDILGKRRTPPTSLDVRVEFSRADSPPRRLTEARLVYRVATASERIHVERAIELSFSKYCSVSASLAPDTRLGWDLELLPAAGEDDPAAG
jgi:putative redox protein